jgi:hypothetical protein
MTLMMYLGNDLIEAIPLSTDRLSQPGYLGSYKRLLKQKHFLLLQQSRTDPEFLVINLNSVSEQSASSVAFA